MMMMMMMKMAEKKWPANERIVERRIRLEDWCFYWGGQAHVLFPSSPLPSDPFCFGVGDFSLSVVDYCFYCCRPSDPSDFDRRRRIEKEAAAFLRRRLWDSWLFSQILVTDPLLAAVRMGRVVSYGCPSHKMFDWSKVAEEQMQRETRYREKERRKKRVSGGTTMSRRRGGVADAWWSCSGSRFSSRSFFLLILPSTHDEKRGKREEWRENRRETVFSSQSTSLPSLFRSNDSYSNSDSLSLHPLVFAYTTKRSFSWSGE